MSEGDCRMTLVLSNEDVQALLTPRACIEPLEEAYREHALGQAANRARTHTYFCQPQLPRAHGQPQVGDLPGQPGPGGGHGHHRRADRPS